MIELGGNIKLVGFKDLEPAKLIVVKKMIGTYAKKISEQEKDFQELSLHLKTIHENPEKEKNSKYELQAKVIIKGKPYNSEITDYNLFFAIDRVLSKLETSHKPNKNL